MCHKVGHLAEICRHRKATEEQVDPVPGSSTFQQTALTPIPVKVEQTEDENEALIQKLLLENSKLKARVAILERRASKSNEQTNTVRALLPQKTTIKLEQQDDDSGK